MIKGKHARSYYSQNGDQAYTTATRVDCSSLTMYRGMVNIKWGTGLLSEGFL